MTDEIAIRVSHVSKRFILPHERVNSVKGIFTSLFSIRKNKTSEIQKALKDINFEVKQGEFFGIVGRNGSGKSTLLKLLANIYQPTSGNIETHGKLVPFIELGVGFNPELTGRENVFLNGAMLGFSQKEITAMYSDIVKFAELEAFMDQKLKNYSSGMQVRLAFSMATRAKADILLVDEVLAVGDADFQRKCFDYFQQLKKRKVTVIFVTHDMSAVRQYCDRAMLIDHSEVIDIASPEEVSKLYTRMFIDEATTDNIEETLKSKRWGDKSVTYSKVELSSSKLTEQDSLVITCNAVANKDVEQVIFGFSIKNATGTAVLGTNTQIKKTAPMDAKKGQKFVIEWTIPNIFSDGEHWVELAIVYGGVQTADWWEEAKKVTVIKEESVPYPVNPNIMVEVS